MFTHNEKNLDLKNKRRNLILVHMPGIFFPKEQKECRRRTKGTNDLYADQHIGKDAKTWRENVAMVWIDYKKT